MEAAIALGHPLAAPAPSCGNAAHECVAASPHGMVTCARRRHGGGCNRLNCYRNCLAFKVFD